jgi:hypothetical protein
MLPHCKSFVPRGILDIDRGIVDIDQGIVDFERGIVDFGRGMDDVGRGMDNVERGIDDVGQARFAPQRTRNTGSTAGRESSCGACLPDAATSQLLCSKPLPGDESPSDPAAPTVPAVLAVLPRG